MSSVDCYFLKYAHLLSEEKLEVLISVPWWYHKFEILPGIVTPGRCPFKKYLLDYPENRNLTGKRVLDIGAWDGPYTLEMSRRGAEVTAFDIQPPSHSGFNAMCRVNELHARHICESVYNLNPAAHGTYDLVTFFGVYYHLRNPLAAFANINSVLPMGGRLLVEGAILEGAPLVDTYWAERAHKLELLRDEPVACYVKGNFQSEWSNWWVPNMKCLGDWLESSGFEVTYAALVAGGKRAFSVARKVREISPEHIVLPAPAAHETAFRLK